MKKNKTRIKRKNTKKNLKTIKLQKYVNKHTFILPISLILLYNYLSNSLVIL